MKENGVYMKRVEMVGGLFLVVTVIGFSSVVAAASAPVSDGGLVNCGPSLERGHAPKISLVVNAEPLGSVIEKLSKIIGTEIAFSDEWMANLPVTAVVRCNTIDQAFKQLCGRLSYALAYEEDNGKLVRVVATVKVPEAGADSLISASDRGMIAKMMEEASKRVLPPPDPNKLEVVPGLTLAALREMEARHANACVDESKSEVVPGLTVAKLKEMEQRCESTPVDESKLEVVPGLSVGAFKSYYGTTVGDVSGM